MRYSGLIALAAGLLVPTGRASGDTADLRFTGACDGSAAVVLPDDRLAVADDESATLRVYPIGGGSGTPHNVAAHLGAPSSSAKFEPDIEAAARLGDRIYWIASHGHNGKGEARPERHAFFATSADAQLTPVGRARHDLLRRMIDDPALASLPLGKLDKAAISPEAGGINIEGLAAGPLPDQLLIGLRSPQAGRSAVVIPLENAGQIVNGDVAPRFGAPVLLDLNGLGLRDMVRRSDGSYVLIAGPTDDSERFALFEWAGPHSPSPKRLPIALSDMHPEAVVESAGRLLLLSDDGDKREAGVDRKCKKLQDPTLRHFDGRIVR